MQVNGINGSSVSALQASAQPVDEESKGIQKQITNAQMQLQRLSSNQEMSAEEKQERRQEIQKQIADLNTELRQHQMELRREQRAKAQSSGDDFLPDTEQELAEKIQTTLTTGSMRSIISAESAMTQMDAHRNVTSGLESRVRVLQGEIKQEARKGNNTERKQDELEQLENRAARASGAQMGVLSGAVKDMQQAAKQERSVQDGQQVKQGTVDKTVPAEKLNLAAGVEAYNKGKFFSNVTIQV